MGTNQIYKHAETCVIWDVEVGDLVCTCSKKVKVRRSVHEWVPTLRDGLMLGLTTDEIAADIGIQYTSILTQLMRFDEYAQEHADMKNRRAVEWERRHQAMLHDQDMVRCIHGVFTNGDGKCNHGKQGRKSQREQAA